MIGQTTITVTSSALILSGYLGKTKSRASLFPLSMHSDHESFHQLTQPHVACLYRNPKETYFSSTYPVSLRIRLKVLHSQCLTNP